MTCNASHQPKHQPSANGLVHIASSVFCGFFWLALLFACSTYPDLPDDLN
jgi:hypothetical protein